MNSLRKFFIAALLLPFIGAAAYGSYDALRRLGSTAATPFFVAPSVNGAAVANGNPQPASLPETAPIAFTATATGWVSIAGGATFDTLPLGAVQAVVKITSVGGGATYSFQDSNDLVNFDFAPYERRPDALRSSGNLTYTSVFVVDVRQRYFGLNVSALTSGTFSGTVYFRSKSQSPNSYTGPSPLVKAANVAPIASDPALAVSLSPNLAVTSSRFNSSASSNANPVKATAGTLMSLQVSNINAATRYLKIYDKASAPTVGTDIPILTIPLATATSQALNLGLFGLTFTNGIAFAITANAVDTDNTAISAGDVKVVFNYN